MKCKNPDCDAVLFGAGWQIEMPSPPHRFNGYLTSRAYKVYARRAYCNLRCRRRADYKARYTCPEKPINPTLAQTITWVCDWIKWWERKQKHSKRASKSSKLNKHKYKKKSKTKKEVETPTYFIPKNFFIDPKYRDSQGYDLGNKQTSGFYSIKKDFK